MGSVTTLLREPPTQLLAGDTLEYLQAIPSDYQSAGWTPNARLIGPAGMEATSCALEGVDAHIKFSGQGTAGTTHLAAGQYRLTVWVTNGNDRATIASHALTILEDLATADVATTHATRMLAVIERAIEARLTGNSDGGIENYVIDGISINKMPIEQLKKLRSEYANEVSRAGNGGRFGSIEMVFTKAGGPIGPRARTPWCP